MFDDWYNDREEFLVEDCDYENLPGRSWKMAARQYVRRWLFDGENEIARSNGEKYAYKTIRDVPNDYVDQMVHEYRYDISRYNYGDIMGDYEISINHG